MKHYPRMLAHKLHQVRPHWREGGARQILEVACDYGHIPAWLYYLRQTHVLRLESRGQVLAFRPRAEYQYARADKGDVEELSTLDPREDSPFMAHLFRGFLARGASCYAIRREGRLVAYNWLFGSHYTVTHDGYRTRQMGLALKESDLVFGNGFIAPEYRMKGLFPFLLQMAVRDHPESTRFFTTIDRLNTNSARSHERIGFRTVGVLTCQRLLAAPYFWLWGSPAVGARFLGFGQPTIPLSELVSDTRPMGGSRAS